MIFSLAVWTMVIAVFFRAAVFFANKVFLPTPVRSQPSIDLPADFLKETSTIEAPAIEASAIKISTETNPFAKPAGTASVSVNTDSNPYAAPQSYGTPAKSGSATKFAIPEPNFGKACGIVLLHFLASGVINVMFSMAPIEPMFGIISLIAVGFIAAMLIYAAMLPTTLGKAAVVYLFQLLLMIVVAGGLIGLFAVILAFTG
ncbi:hypothetical protein N9Y42_02450 [Mariniblastus sp.]|nr:hypothetical protein [Mariniblastus sp.]